MAASKQDGYNADKRAEKRAEREFTIGGKKFTPRKKNNKLMKALIEAVPDTPEPEHDEEFEVNGEVRTRKVLSEAQRKQMSLDEIDLIYTQVNELLVAEGAEDPNDESARPGVDFLDEHLEFEDAQGVIEAIMPDAPKPQA